MILGAIYIRPALMEDSINGVAEPFDDIEKSLDRIIYENDWTPNECQIMIGADINTN